MYVVHGTRKFLERVGAPSRAEDGYPTTVLGDWYATVLFWRPQSALFVNESILLPVLLPFAPAASVIDRFSAAMATVLRGTVSTSRWSKPSAQRWPTIVLPRPRTAAWSG